MQRGLCTVLWLMDVSGLLGCKYVLFFFFYAFVCACVVRAYWEVWFFFVFVLARVVYGMRVPGYWTNMSVVYVDEKSNTRRMFVKYEGVKRDTSVT